jgi:hypothetical protein
VSTYRVTATRRIDAPARLAYDIIADYRDGHPRIIPPPWFRDIRVETGGIGSGTTFNFDVYAFGAKRTLHAVVTEPEPGRVIVETYRDGTVTSFTVAPADGDRACDVTIASDMPRRAGIAGWIERAMMRRFLHRVFEAELALLEHAARSSAAHGAATTTAAATLGSRRS